MTHRVLYGGMQLWRLKINIHVSWLIALCAAGLVIGTALVPAFDQLMFGSILWLIIGIVFLIVALWKHTIALVPIVIIAGLLIGLWRGSTTALQLSVYENVIGKVAVISGKVVDDPDDDGHGTMKLRLGDIVAGKQTVAGKVWVSARTKVPIKRGDVVTIKGVVSEGFGSFGATMYRASIESVKRSEPGDVARRVRDWFADKIRLTIAEPQASLGLGYLLGQKRALPEDLQQALVVTGLTHVVVASGYNLTILVRLARRLFVRVSKYLAMLAASTMIISFIAVTGLSPSMSRAGLVSGLSLAAWYYGRKFHPLVLLPFAAAITVLIDPTYAWNDLGWQLSFTAFGGVMILAPLLQRYFFGDKEPGTVRQILGETISAHITTLPILVLAFGQFSNVAIIANLLVLPFVPLAMLLTFVAGIGVMVAPPLAAIIGLPAQWLLAYMTTVIQYFAGLSWAQTALSIAPWVVAVAYAAIIVICVYLWRVTKYDLSDANMVE